ncbi:hypothetical protein P7K49_005497, partial [Saguinus oedipus]
GYGKQSNADVHYASYQKTATHYDSHQKAGTHYASHSMLIYPQYQLTGWHPLCQPPEVSSDVL